MDVRADTELFALALFRTGKGRAPHKILGTRDTRGIQSFQSRSFSQTEVDQFDIETPGPVSYRHDVARFDVAVDQLAGLGRLQGLRDLQHDSQRSSGRKRTLPPDIARQIFAFDKFHGVEVGVSLLPRLVNGSGARR